LASAPSPTRTFVPLPAITHEDAFGGAPKAAREGACAPQIPVSDVLARIGGQNKKKKFVPRPVARLCFFRTFQTPSIVFYHFLY